MQPPRCPYRGNASALRASRGVHNKSQPSPKWYKNKTISPHLHQMVQHKAISPVLWVNHNVHFWLMITIGTFVFSQFAKFFGHKFTFTDISNILKCSYSVKIWIAFGSQNYNIYDNILNNFCLKSEFWALLSKALTCRDTCKEGPTTRLWPAWSDPSSQVAWTPVYWPGMNQTSGWYPLSRNGTNHLFGSFQVNWPVFKPPVSSTWWYVLSFNK